MDEAKFVANCIDRVSKYLENEFRLKDWEAMPIASDTVLIIIDEMKKAKEANE